MDLSFLDTGFGLGQSLGVRVVDEVICRLLLVTFLRPVCMLMHVVTRLDIATALATAYNVTIIT